MSIELQSMRDLEDENAALRRKVARMNSWSPIVDVDCLPPYFDVVAKKWDAETDEFLRRRFFNCRVYAGAISGVPEDYRPTHWMEIPASPDPL